MMPIIGGADLFRADFDLSCAGILLIFSCKLFIVKHLKSRFYDFISL